MMPGTAGVPRGKEHVRRAQHGVVVLMSDYQIQPPTRRCAATGRELNAGERYFSVLREQDGKMVRQDFSAEAWQGPPEGAFSFWAGKVPAQEQARKVVIDDDMLMECFQRLEGQTEPAKVNFCYVVALLLMRRKRLKFDAVKTRDGQEMLQLRCARSGKMYEVVNPRLTEQEMAEVQDEVFKVLGWQ
jgi:hypothetical protein